MKELGVFWNPEQIISMRTLLSAAPPATPESGNGGQSYSGAVKHARAVSSDPRWLGEAIVARDGGSAGD
ncbi:MAG: hypothetical protein Kilf2KO_31100 [Rhodospirillales bacterium]